MNSDIFEYELNTINNELNKVLEKIEKFENKYYQKFYQFERHMIDDSEKNGEHWEDYFDWKSLAHRKKMLNSKINQLKKLYNQNS
ncbi:MAG: hypothetical protein OEY49_18700 [Candidatus Heimdallarchaeota archaeon]|nr:hypothetical protein [Candidatus Heimdallarchaeota archaeon]